MIKQQIANVVKDDLSYFGLDACCEAVLNYIASSPIKSDFYLTLSELAEHINGFDLDKIKEVVNYLSTAGGSANVLDRRYCFVDDQSCLQEIHKEALIGYHETKKLYDLNGKEVVEPYNRIFLLYKTNVARVSE